MSTEMTTASSLEIEAYCKAVRDALSNLPPDVSDDLLEDLPDHLREVLAEGDGSLRDRLGEPAAYADELRAAAGIDPIDGHTASGLRAGLSGLVQRGASLAERMDSSLGRLLGYGRLMDLVRALRPAWWVLRGWIVAQFVCGVRHRDGWNGIVPTLHGSRLSGLVVILVAIAASIWIGRRSSTLSAWPRGLMAAASAAVLVWAIAVLANGTGQNNVMYVSPASSDPSVDFSDLYVYDQSGTFVPGARLYDQSGNPVQLGAPYCADGQTAPGSQPDSYNADGSPSVWTYPLCPNDPGPFRSGPGPAAQAGTATPAPATATPSAPPSGTPRR
ncbi:MAG: HAAS signaling domain-containing protein [Jatrophihabitantaceae bacterium]